MAEHATDHSAHDKHHHHVVPPGLYLLNLLALAFFMGLTIWASTINFGATWINNIVAILIALIKMMLVIMIFMGVKWSTRLTKLWAATGFVWFLLMAIIFGDYFTREWEAVPGWDPDHRKHPVLGSKPHTSEHAGEVSPTGGG